MELYGFAGKVLHVNLSDGTIEVEEPTEAFYRTYMGGSAMGLYYLLKGTPPNADPLGPDNTLVFAVGPATGTPISGQSRCALVAKSPLTDAVGDSQAGGFWPAELKFAGFDAIVIRGTSPKPVYLWIHDGEAKLRDAQHLWGKFTYDTECAIKEELEDPKIEVVQIGPSGEKLVRFAAVMSMSNRAHGRCGLGAVMGSKKLKAIAVRGTGKPDVVDRKALVELARKAASEAEDWAYGTSGNVVGQERVGGLPTRNWASGSMGEERAEKISGQKMYNELLRGAPEGQQDDLGRGTCYACTIRCKRVVEAEWQGHPLLPEYGGPEYETAATFGSYCDNEDLGAIIYANQLCNQYGVDTISAGATMAFAIDCFECGLIAEEDTGGVRLTWGDAEALITMLEKTLSREGFGDTLAEGAARAAERIGNGAEHLAMAARKQELPAHMPQAKRSLALIYATNPFGADHMSHTHDPSYTPQSFERFSGPKLSELGLTDPQPATVLNPAKVAYALITQYATSAVETVSMCQFVFGPVWQVYSMEELADAVNFVTGWDVTVEELLTLGQRRLNLLRAFNARDGYTRDDDTLPDRLFDQPLKGGSTDGLAVDRAEWEASLDEYYRQAGWDVQTGNPTRETLEAVNLGWVADMLGI